MRIVVDMQGLQATNRLRGIGRYTRAITRAVIEDVHAHGRGEVVLALNGMFPETIDELRAEFGDLLGQENIRVWYAPGPVCGIAPENAARRQAAELVREAFLASLKPDIVVVTSLFEGLVDDAVTSVGSLSRGVPTAVILYDLIPLIHRHHYLKNPFVEAWYENKLGHLMRADLLLAISESSRQEALRHLGFGSDQVVNISTAADPQFKPGSVGPAREREVRERYDLHTPFVMYTGGIDYRKNIEGLVRAYASLPAKLRKKHQLAVVCSIQPDDRSSLEHLAKKHGVESGRIVYTGYVPEEDLLALYHLCELFVFPSLHEGFGLPALEAMASGRAVIGSNTSSLPEVIGRADALFDPGSDEDMAAMIEKALTDASFRSELERHGTEQAKVFSWEKSAALATSAIEKYVKRLRLRPITAPIRGRRPTLAYISPLPPERSGISHYSAELLPELARHYDIDVVVDQGSVADAWIRANCRVRSVNWLRANAGRYDRVLYHVGNSHFHKHMFALMEDVPGVVVLHDFYISGIVAHMDFNGFTENGWPAELYRAHGYDAVRERFSAADVSDVIWKYPCNNLALRHARGVIVHSENSMRLAKQWKVPTEAVEWSVIPHLRVPSNRVDRLEARGAVNLGADDIVVCSFGLLGPTKLNHRLVDAWLASELAADERCVLVFVGENGDCEYGQRIVETIKREKLSSRVRITGWTDTETFRNYLAAADIGVQLRTLSRGETSGTVLDCMNYGVPIIVNSNGSMADLDTDAAWKLPDEFVDSDLVEALNTLRGDAGLRERMGERAREIILERHAPRECAEQYSGAIERAYDGGATGPGDLVRAIASAVDMPGDRCEWMSLARDVARTIAPRLAARQLLVDVSELVRVDSRSGIQRVVRSVLREWLVNPPEGLRVEPIYAANDHGYRYARRFALEFLGCPADALKDEPIEYGNGDIFLGLDLQPQVVVAQKEFYRELRRHGVLVSFVVYDMLCVLMPQHFFDGAADGFTKWLEVVSESDGAVCISRSVARDLEAWVEEHGREHASPFRVSWFHLGADVESSVPTAGLPDDAGTVLGTLKQGVSFLMVGTIEPRKGHGQTLSAFELLWDAGAEVNLVIVGKEGWMVEGLVERIGGHPQLGKRLFWLSGISDEYLERIYAVSDALVAASEGEGFGLPLIEAAQHKLPIIARDIPVFREVAGEHAYYFKGLEPSDLSEVVAQVAARVEQGDVLSSEGLPWLTWKQSAQRLLAEVLSFRTHIEAKEDEHGQAGNYELASG